MQIEFVYSIYSSSEMRYEYGHDCTKSRVFPGGGLHMSDGDVRPPPLFINFENVFL